MHRRIPAYLAVAAAAIVVALAIAAPVGAVAQTPQSAPSGQAPGDTLRPVAPRPSGGDSTGTRSRGGDTLGGDTLGAAGADSLRVSTRTASGADTAITYSARDSMKLSVKGKIMRLFGDAEVTKGAMRLTAGYIEIDFNKSELLARAVYDSATKQYTGVPVFKDASQEFSALSMRYNFKTGKGITEAAETKFDEGFYRGERIKRVDENTLFVENGVYTTCDAPHPHYFFRSQRMKVVVGDKIYVDQPTLDVADVPIFFIPIGVFFARSGGKQSGVIIPTWSQNATRGFTIEGLGYFWAGNDYVDSKLTTNLYSKGGYSLTNVTRFRNREWGIDLADVDYTFGRTRDDPDAELETSHHLRYMHQQKLGRRTQLGGVLDISTLNAIRQTQTRAERLSSAQDITRQLLTSNFSFSTTLFDIVSFSSQFDRTQNIVTDELTMRAPVTVSIPAWTPFSSAGGEPGIFDNLALSYVGRATWEQVRQDTITAGVFRTRDVRRGIQHSPSISLTLPKIGYFNVVPSFNAQGSTFFRRTIREYDSDSVLVTRTVPGIHQTLTWGASLGLSTVLYGIVQPRVLGINALRHVLRPIVTLNYHPDFSEPRYEYFDSVLNPRSGRFEQYSRFAADASVAPVPTPGLSNSIDMRLENTFEAKIAQGDTLPDRAVTLMTLNAGASYNAAAPDFKWSQVSMSATTQLGSFGSLSANLALDPYGTDTAGVRVPELLLDRGEGLLRITSGGVRFGLSFSDQGFGSTIATNPPIDSVATRRERFNFEPIPFDEPQFFGEQVRGAGDYVIPWTVNIDGTYTVSQGYRTTTLTKHASLSFGFNLGLTPTTRLTTSVSYDLIEKEITIPSISFYKDLHCWEMQFDWVPSGFSPGFYFRLGIKAAQLRDIQLERYQ
jgi:hypothetical protein